MPFIRLGNQVINTDHVAAVSQVKNAYISIHWQLTNNRGEILASIFESTDKKTYDAVTEWVRGRPGIDQWK